MKSADIQVSGCRLHAKLLCSQIFMKFGQIYDKRRLEEVHKEGKRTKICFYLILLTIDMTQCFVTCRHVCGCFLTLTAQVFSSVDINNNKSAKSNLK